ncbi:MAG TPA: hypothetical protein VN649_01200 [Ramlibacter sp.]|nr:hypothetical protein [Ramlibacter sp.]
MRPLFVLIVLAYYRLAMRQIDPLHPDVPEIVRRINDLERERAA